MEGKFTKIENDIIYNSKIDPYAFRVYCCIKSCNPSFPSYAAIAKWTGICRDRINKSLKQLEIIGLIFRFKQGRKVVYKTRSNYLLWDKEPGVPLKFKNVISLPDRPIEIKIVSDQSVPRTDTSLSHRLIIAESVCPTDSNKTNSSNKTNLIRGEGFLQNLKSAETKAAEDKIRSFISVAKDALRGIKP